MKKLSLSFLSFFFFLVISQSAFATEIPQVENLDPTQVNTSPGEYKLLTSTYTDADGAADIKQVRLIVAEDPTQTGGKFFVYYNQLTNKLYSRNTMTGGWQGGFAPGSDNIIYDMTGTVDCAGSSVEIDSHNPNRLIVKLRLALNVNVNQPIHLKVWDRDNLIDGWKEMGRWTVGNIAPETGTVTPDSGSGNVDEVTDFETTCTDGNGADDIKLVRFKFAPDKNRRGFSLQYNCRNNKLQLWKFDDPEADEGPGAWIGGYRPGSDNIIECSYGKLYCQDTTIGRDGETLTINWSVSFSDKLGEDPVNSYLWVYDNAGLKDGYNQVGTWQVIGGAIHYSPENVSLSPDSGSCEANERANFITEYSDENGYQDIRYGGLKFGSKLQLRYVRASNELSIWRYPEPGEKGAWLGNCAPGSDNIIDYTAGKLYCADTTVNGTGNNLTVNWSVSFDENIARSNPYTTSLLVKDMAGLKDGWEKFGTWKVNDPNNGPENISINPVNGQVYQGEIGYLECVYQDLDGADDISRAKVLISESFDDITNALYLKYENQENKLYLYDPEDGEWEGGYAPGSDNVLGFLGIKFYCEYTTVERNGTDLIITWASSSDDMYPEKKVFLHVSDIQNATDGWDEFGTWEIIPLAPETGTVVPDESGALPDTKVSFVTTYSDPEGFADIKEAQFKISRSEDEEGFCLKYDQPENKLYAWYDFGMGPGMANWSGGYAPGSDHEIIVPEGTFYCDASSASGSGEVLTITWSVSFPEEAASNTPYHLFLYVKDKAGWDDGWNKVGTWEVIDDNIVPLNISVQPITGISAPNKVGKLKATYADANGVADIKEARLLVADNSNEVSPLYVRYDQFENKLYIYEQMMQGWSGGYAPGSDHILQTMDDMHGARLYCEDTTVTIDPDDDTRLIVEWAFSFSDEFTDKKTFLYVEDRRGLSDGLDEMGTWSVINQSPETISIAPAEGASNPEQKVSFTTVFRDPDGYEDIELAQFRMGDDFRVRYNQAENKLYLLQVTEMPGVPGIWLGGFAPGVDEKITNKYATLYCAETTVSGQDDTLTVTWAISFTDELAGEDAYQTGLWVRDLSGAEDGWDMYGEWIVNDLNLPPENISTDPVDGQSIVNLSGEVIAVYKDPNGAVDLKEVYLLISEDTGDLGNALYLKYNQQENLIYLYNPMMPGSPNNWGIGHAPGEDYVIEDWILGIKVYCKDITVEIDPDDDTLLRVKWVASFANEAGPLNVYLYCEDLKGLTDGFDLMGTWLVGIDAIAPVITPITPEENEEIANPKPEVKAEYRDIGGSGIDTSTVIIEVNSVDVTADADITEESIAYQVTDELIEGAHSVKVQVADLSGNVASRTWGFSLRSGTDVDPVTGGTVYTPCGRGKLVIPPGALNELTRINIRIADNGRYEDAKPLDSELIYCIEAYPDGLTFNSPATLTLDVPQDIPGTPVYLGLYDDAAGKINPTGQETPVPIDGITVPFTLTHFSTYAAFKGLSSSGAPIGAGVNVPLPDLFTGSFAHEVPIMVSPGRKGIQPGLKLQYRSSNPDSWLGKGWDISAGRILRSNHDGVPAYNDTEDTYIFVTTGGSLELVHLIDNLYQAKVESGFTRFFKEGDTWRAVEKNGMVSLFGELAESKEEGEDASGNTRTYSWGITRLTDNNGNYIIFDYTKDQGKSYLDRIEYTGNENTGVGPKCLVDFGLEARSDQVSSFLSGREIITAQRLQDIRVEANGQLARRYALNYTNSQLTSIEQYGTDNKTQSPDLIFSYNGDAIVASTSGWSKDLGDPGSPISGDFDGDGRIDIGSCDSDGDWVVGLSTGSGFSTSTWLTGFKVSDLATLITGDFNRDGKTDIAGYHGDEATWKVCYSQGNKFSSPANKTGPEIGGEGGDFVTNGNFKNGFSSWSTWGANVSVANNSYAQVWYDAQGTSGGCSGGEGRLYEFNGGFQQKMTNSIKAGTKVTFAYQWQHYIYNNGNGSSGCWNRVYLIKPDGNDVEIDFHNTEYSGWVATQKDISEHITQTGQYSLQFTAGGYVHGHRGGGYAYAGAFFTNIQLMVDEGTRAFTGDFNFDGKSDLLIFDQEDGSWKVSLMGDNGFGAQESWLSGFGDSTDSEPTTGDFNGDGLTDMGIFDKTNGSWQVAFSNGKAFIDQGVWKTGFGTDKSPLGGDFNKDGLSDIGYFDKASGDWYVAYSTGESFTSSNVWLSGYGADERAYNGDYNGDGLPDSAYYDGDTGTWNIGITDGDHPYLLREIDNGTGGTTAIEYEPSTGFVATSMPFSLQAVKSVTMTDVLPVGDPEENYSQEFEYQGGYFDHEKRNFCGFKRAKVTDPITGNYTWSEFLQGTGSEDGALKGKVKEIQAFDGLDRPISQSVNTWEVQKAGPDSNQLGTPILTKVEETVYEMNGLSVSTRNEFSYDNLGNIIETINHGDIADDNDGKSAQTVYGEAYGEDFNQALETTLKDADGNVITQKNFEYDANGNLIREIFWLDGAPENPEVTYAYDSFGNLESSTDSLGHTTSNTYETTFYSYVEKISNSLGHEIAKTYDPRFGAVLSIADTNGATSSTVYDALGRVMEVKNALDHVTTVCQYPDFNTKITIQKAEQGDLRSIEYYDGLKRAYKTVSSGEDGDYPKDITSESFFNERGMMDRESLPHYVDAPSSTLSYIRYEYDLWGRTKRTFQDYPGTDKDTEVSVDYLEPLYTETINPKSIRKGTRSDVYGNIIEVTEFNGEETYLTTYEYDTRGSLIKLTDNAGNETEIFYDSLGRKISMNDPDMGVWSYEYDLGGNLVKQIDAKGQIIEFEYDELSRLTTKSLRGVPAGDDEAISAQYEYDDSSKDYCTGRLSKVDDQSGSSEFFYDLMGREIKSKKTIGTDTFTVLRSYDDLDRLRTLTYPDGEVVVYDYDANSGLLESVGGNELYVEDIKYDAQGQIRSIEYGNNTKTRYDYADDFKLENIITEKTGNPTPLQNLSYTFDENGNIAQLVDQLRSNTRSYQYDDLDRLTRADNIPDSGAYTSFTYQYDSIGNMTYKSDVGYMAYGNNAGPHAVTSAGSKNYEYDENGNMISSGTGGMSPNNRTMQYDVENRLTRVVNSMGGGQTEFTYDGDGGRVKKSLRGAAEGGDETIYVGSLYEESTESAGMMPFGSTIKHIFAGSNRVCTVKSYQMGPGGGMPGGGEVTTFSYFHSDHLGSSNIITDETGAIAQRLEYAPYGKTTVDVKYSSFTGVNYKFTGKEEDASTGLYYYGARYYDPEIGRFIQADTIVARPGDPQDLNRYSYARNNPLVYTDPSGHFWKSIFGFLSSIISIIFPPLAPAMWVINTAISAFGAIQSGNIGGFIGGMIGGAVFGGLGKSIGLSLSSAMGESAFSFMGGAIVGAVEFGIAGFGAGFGAALGSGAGFSDALMAGGMGAASGAVNGAAIQGSYMAGWQDKAHGLSREEIYEGGIKRLRVKSLQANDKVKGTAGSRPLGDPPGKGGFRHRYIREPVWFEMGPDSQTGTIEIMGEGSFGTTQKYFNGHTSQLMETSIIVSKSGLDKAIAYYKAAWVDLPAEYCKYSPIKYNSNYAVNSVIYGAGGDIPTNLGNTPQGLDPFN